MHKKSLRVKDFHGRKEYICVLAQVLRGLGLVRILALAPRIVSPPDVHSLAFICTGVCSKLTTGHT